MKSNRFIVALGVLLFLALACEKEPSLTLSSPPSLEFTGDGSTGTISFSSNRDWTATASEPWVTVTPSSGKASDGPAVISVNLSANDTYSDRAANVTITAEGLSQTVQILQAANPGLVVPTKSFELASDATSFEVEVQSNVEYSVAVSSDWIRQTGTRGLKSNKLVFSVQENTSYDARSARVDITPSDAGVAGSSVSVKQAQKDAILIEDTSFDMPCGGGEIEVKVQANVNYEVESTVSWIQHTGTRSLKNMVVRLKVDENTTTSSRQGSVTISQLGGNIKHTVTVKQGARVAVTGVVLDKTSLEMVVGEEAVLTATVLPEDASDKTVTWESDNTAVAEVQQDGSVTAVSAGTATVTARAGEKFAACTVTVAKETIQIGDVKEVPEEGGTVEVDIQYNTDYTVNVDDDAADWIGYVQTRAMTNGKLQFQIAPNDCEDIRTGTVTINSRSGNMEPITLSFRQASKMRRLLTEFYYAMDGPNWTVQGDWCTDESIRHWWGVMFDSWDKGVVGLEIRTYGLKGEIPACIGEFSDLTYLYLSNEPGIVGGLPEEIGKLSNLEKIVIQHTSITHLPDVFEGLTNLRSVFIQGNEQLTGPLPESIGTCSDKLESLILHDNNFTGNIPASWVGISNILQVANNRLTGKLSNLFSKREDFRAFVNNYNLWQQKGYGFDISDIEIPGCYMWIDGPVAGPDGTLFTFDDVIGKSKYTVYVIWASWCPFSRTLMPALKEYYETYRQDGLEVIATAQVGVDEYGAGHLLDDREGYFKEVTEKGYDQFYSFYWPDYGNSYLNTTPNAEVYDHNGDVLFSSMSLYPDPVRNRFSKTAATELIPFLESLLGPASPPDPYSSKDYSKDGQVMTLQKATVGKGINIVFMGDAYTDKDMAAGGVYETAMKQAMEQFFAVEPYKTFRNRFNVYAVKVVSKNGRIGSGYTTALGTYFGNGTYVDGNNDKCFEYALKVPGINSRDNLLVSVLVNSNHNAGTAVLYRSDQSAVARVPSFGNDPDAFGSTLQHEAGGHGFAFLADEYSNNSGTPPQYLIDEYNDVYNRYGWYSNVDFTDDPGKIRWSEFLKDSRYDGQVGIYEGAALYNEGAWRPSVNSIMRENMGGFNAPSRWAIYKQIMKRSGEDYSWEKFLEYDAVNRRSGVSSFGKAPQKAPGSSFEHGAPPVIMP